MIPFANAQAPVGELIFRADTGDVIATVRDCSKPEAFALKEVTRIDVREYKDRMRRPIVAGDTLQLEELGYWEGAYPSRNYVSPNPKEFT